MRLGKEKYYLTPSRKYPNKPYRVLIYELEKEPELDRENTILFTYKDIGRLIENHLDNEDFNDKNMQRSFSDFWKKLKYYEFLLKRKAKERIEKYMKEVSGDKNIL